MPEGDIARRLVASSLAVVLAACGATGLSRQPTRIASEPLTSAATPEPVITSSPDGGSRPTSSPAGGSRPTSSPDGGSRPTSSPAPPPGSSVVAWPVPGPSYFLTDPSRRHLEARQLQERLDRLARRYRLPGVAVTIRWPDGREWSGAAGKADVRKDRAVTTATAFALGSVSKTYTAARILALVEEGRLSLDDRVRRLLPTLKLDQRITVRMLLDHTSGLSDYFLNPAIDRPLQGKPSATWSTRQTLRYMRKPLFPPGRRWAYSNTNYLLLGLVAEQIDGRPLEVQIRTRLLEPLGLEETWAQADEKPRAETSRGHRIAGTGADRKPVPIIDGQPVMPFRSVITAAGGAGNMAATSRDAARWMDALVRGDVLRPQTKQLMLTAVAYPNKLAERMPYGLGLQMAELAGRTAIGHSGRLLGFRAVVRVLPDDGFTIAVLTNQSTLDPTLLASAMLTSVLIKAPDCICPEVQ